MTQKKEASAPCPFALPWLASALLHSLEPTPSSGLESDEGQQRLQPCGLTDYRIPGTFRSQLAITELARPRPVNRSSRFPSKYSHSINPVTLENPD